MAIAFTFLGTPSIDTSSAASSYATPSWTPSTTALLILDVATTVVPGPPNIPTVSGNGITWTQISTQLVSTSVTRITKFRAYGSGSSAGATTIDFAGQNQRDCQAVFLQCEGTDVANGESQTIVQSVTNTATASASLSITLAAGSNANNRPQAGFVQTFVAGNAPQTNWTEYWDIADNEVLETQYRSDAFDTAALCTASSGTGVWAGGAIEIKALATAAFIPVRHRMVMGIGS